MANELIQVEQISHSLRFEETGRWESVLHDVSFSVAQGEFVSIIGPSGSGKSTLLKIIAGLIKPKHGTVKNSAEKMAMVFQNFAIFPWLSVLDNVAFGLKMAGVGKEARRRQALELMREVGLVGFADKHPRELSGGMRQRVGIARALAVGADLILMDEPFSSLDELTAEKLRAEVMALWQKYKMTVIMVTHLVEEAVELSDKIVVVSARPGRVKKILSVDLPRPRLKRSPEYFQLVDSIIAEIDR